MKTIRIISIVLLVLVAVNAIIAGLSFMSDPSGTGLSISTTTLRHSPFSDFLVPGIALFFLIGILNLVVALFTLIRIKQYPKFVIYQGLILLLWIIVQVIMLRQILFLHYVIGFIGLLLLLFGFIMSKEERVSEITKNI